MADEEVPDGVLPILITGPTQTIIECVIDEHVTEENPHKLIPKDVFLKDIQTRAAVSDFQPFKKSFIDSDCEEILVVMDAEFLYGQNFYLCMTEKAKNTVLYPGMELGEDGAPVGDIGQAGPGAAAEESNEVFVYRPPSPRPWISMGSEKEIEEIRVKNERPLINLRCSRKRKHFGKKFNFSTSNGEILNVAAEESRPNQTHRMLHDMAIQSVKTKTEGETQTFCPEMRNQWSQYEARTESVVSNEELEKKFANVIPLVNLALQQNELVNVFDDPWAELGDEDDGFGSKSDGHLREYQSFTDLMYSKDKRLTAVEWHPHIKSIIAVSCAQRYSLYERIEKAPKLLLSRKLILIWSFQDPIHPCILLEAPADVYCFKFNPTNPNLIAAGCINGQIVIWDIAEHKERLVQEKAQSKKKTSLFGEKVGPETPIIMWKAVSSIENGHKGAVTQINWVPAGLQATKNGVWEKVADKEPVQIFTTSSDGSYAIWDLRPPPVKKSMTQLKKKKPGAEDPLEIDPWAHLNLVWKPLLKATLSKGENGCHRPSRICFDFSGEDGFPKPEIFIGTQDGDVLWTKIKLVKDGDSGKMGAPPPLLLNPTHSSSITCVRRSPFFKDVLLTVGGCNFSIWKESDDATIAKIPLLSVHSNDKKYTAGEWSPTRPGLILMATDEGNIEVWDLLEKTHEPSVVQNVTTAAITDVTASIINAKLHLLAVSDSCGTLHILELPWNLRHPTQNEKSSVHGYINREEQRILYFDETENHEEESENLTLAADADMLENIQDDELEGEFKDYLKLEKEILETLTV
ncbi:Oidioi.mRNA.OKI2018_I69.chr2.g6214.t1.cds [Oikopleura dioica]|uniref:Oidioi.mRNA.OKI2018_I69.chr2.g6214.t1.cds n=2 Tax=Oikopleura dioica TaxID=34765 RepID=A0ABN7T2Q0_OIKDI|nr:Oidioi.mRNA.OKI2018_I69.chr2.g6214.t1.cds [Oikopleura dioica]